jgi:hypothetical protein
VEQNGEVESEVRNVVEQKENIVAEEKNLIE